MPTPPRFLRLRPTPAIQPTGQPEAAGVARGQPFAPAALRAIPAAALLRDHRTPARPVPGRVLPERLLQAVVDRQRLTQVVPQRVRPTQQGLSRDVLKHPLASSNTPRLNELFSDPKEASKSFYLPEYRLAQGSAPTAGGTLQRLRIAFEAAGPETAGKLVLVLASARPAAHDGQTQAAALPHRPVQLVLRYVQPLGGTNGQKVELAFESLSQLSDGNWGAELTLNSAAERSGLELALTRPECQAQLVLIIEADLAWPLATVPAQAETGRSPAAGLSRLAMPGLHLHGAEEGAALSGAALRRKQVLALNPAILAQLVRPSVAAVAGAPAEQRYAEGTLRLEQVLAPTPFCFASNDPLFAGTTPSSALGQLVPVRVEFQGKFHDYYQITSQPALFYYLPDRFVVGREEDPATKRLEPAINVNFLAGQNEGDAPRAQVAWRLTPSVNAERLEAALVALSAHCPGKQPLLGPLNCSSGLRFTLQLPGTPSMAERPDARIDLVAGIDDRFELSIDELNRCLDALARGSSLELQGQLSIDLPDLPTLRLPCMGLLESDPASVLATEERGLADGSLEVRLINRAESPLELRQLPVRIERGETSVPARLVGLDLSGPRRLGAGEAIDFQVVPLEPLPALAPGAASSPLDAVFDLSAVGVLLDRETLLAAVLDPSVPARYQRPIEVELHPSEFEPQSDTPQRTLLHVIVEFEGGPQIKLDATKPKVQLALSRPITEFLQNNSLASSYRYRLVVQRRGGQLREQEWRSDHLDFLYPELPA
jgi:hypothetical protein